MKFATALPLSAFFLSLVLPAAPAEATPELAGARTPEQSVAAIVSGIIGYSRWPQAPATIRLCVAGTPRLAGQLGSIQPPATQKLAVSRIGLQPAPVACDVLYIGAMPQPTRAQLVTLSLGRPILTIAEDDPLCRSGAMFCLLTRQSPLSFRLNLDAVSRSQVRVDPRVLRISGGTL